LAAIIGLSDKMGDALFSLMCTIALDFGAVIALLTAELRNAEERKPEPVAMTLPPTPKVINVSPEPQALPAPEIRPQLPGRPRPKLAASTGQPIGAVLDYLHDCIKIVAGKRTDMADAFVGYSAWCKAKALRPMGLAEFVEEMEGLCPQCGIHIAMEGDCDCLVDVQLAPAQGRQAS
jgi:hypothetical protein